MTDQALDRLMRHPAEGYRAGRRQIAMAVDALPSPLRTAVTLTARRGWSVGQAAKAEGCSTTEMHRRVYRAKMILKARLGRHF